MELNEDALPALHPCLLPPLLGDRARLNALEGPGALSVGWLGKWQPVA